MTQPTIEHHQVQTNGVTLHVAQAGDKDAPLVILLHGFPEFWYGWHAQITFLAQHGYRVWAPDQRGYNLSDKPAGIDAYRIGTLAEDVIGLIDAAGRESAYVVGHDWGAGVAWMTAITYPERVKKLVILNVPHPVALRETFRTQPKQWLKSFYIGIFQIPWLPERLLTFGDGMGAAQMLILSSNPRTFSDADFTQYIRAWKQPGAMNAMLNWYRAMVQRTPPMPADPRVHVPTLIIWGARDVALSREMAQLSVEQCDDARLVMFEQASHWVQHEETHQVNALLADFLK
ncbi:MAG: alpha/beta hydrolase [Chloroflexota bacterium]